MFKPLLSASLFSLLLASAANAQEVIVTTAGSIVAININQDTHVVNIREIWNNGTPDDVRLLFKDFNLGYSGADWTVVKTISDYKPDFWSGFKLKALDPKGDPIPGGESGGVSFRTPYSSNFAPGGAPAFTTISQNSDFFPTVIDFSGGLVSRGDQVTFKFGIHFDSVPEFVDTPFILSETAVSVAMPEPASWAMMLVGFGSLGVAMRLRPKATAETA